MPPLDGVRAKLSRIEEHLAELQAEIRAYVETEPFRALGALAGDRFSVRLQIERPPPPRASVIVGDIAHNARSALDHLIWQLVIANGGTPGRAHQWPILDRAPTSASETRRFEAMIEGIGSEAHHRIVYAQAYQRPDSPDQHVLYALRELSNTDKHRLPLAMVAAIREHDEPQLDLQFDDVQLPDPPRYGLVVNTPLDSGDEFMFIEGVVITGPHPHVVPTGTLPNQVAFGEVLTTLEGLVQIRDYVGMAIDDLGSLVEGTDR